jgi:hypothetical protein
MNVTTLPSASTPTLFFVNSTKGRHKPSLQTKWLHLGASVIGKMHILNGIPCQDAHYVGALSNRWQIAVVSDGAGSYENSHYGSALITSTIASILGPKLKRYKWYRKGSLPNNKVWNKIALEAFNDLYAHLEEYADVQGFPFHSLGATVNLIVFSEKGCLSAHIGDGRAAIQLKSGHWEAAMTPFKGDQVGETVFLTSPYTWHAPDECIQTSVIRKPIRGVAIMSDGMENYCFRCNAPISENEDLWMDYNEPFKPFFDNNTEVFRQLKAMGKSTYEIEHILANYLLKNHPRISQENDDKTITFSMLKSK